MDRKEVSVETPYGPVVGKHMTYGSIEKTTVEYESAKELAKTAGVPLSELLK